MEGSNGEAAILVSTAGPERLRMNDSERVELGKTKLLVSRMGIGPSYGIGTKDLEEAFEKGINYFYFGTFRTSAMAKAIHHLAPGHREELVVAVQSYARWPYVLRKSVESSLRKMRLDYSDLLILGKVDYVPAQKLLDEAVRLKESGKVRFLAVSGHVRAKFAQHLQRGLFDAIMVRYNAAHRGAEKDVFPLLPANSGMGVICYTATRWGTLLKGTLGERAPLASDCYRFVLANPSVSVCLSGPKNGAEMQEALKVLTSPPMNEEELAWMRRVGDAVYRKKRRNLLQMLFE